MYKRVLLKLSGEQLAGQFEVGVDPARAGWLAKEVKKAIASCQIVLVVGGGNMVRGAEVAGQGIRRVTGDHMGMLSSLINSVALTDIFEANKISTRCLSNIFADQVAEMYSYRRAIKHLEKGRVVIIAGGIGRPYFTTDTGAVNLALELECEAVLKATKVDGVYDKDPEKHDSARKLKELSHQQAVENSNIRIMDKAALGLAMEHQMPIIVFNLLKDGNIQHVIEGQPVGTKIV
jgi:uridylate kinase